MEGRVERAETSNLSIYDVRFGTGYDWATIVVNANGQVFIGSDYGNWFYWWSHPGSEGIKPFLTSIDDHYLMGKLGGAPKHLDWKTTERNLISDILRARRRRKLDANDAREAYDHISSISPRSSAELFSEISHVSWFDDVWPDFDVPTEYSHDPGLVGFVEKIWPIFVKELRKELQGA